MVIGAKSDAELEVADVNLAAALLKFGKHSPYCVLSPLAHYDHTPEDCTCGFTNTLKNLGLEHPPIVERGSTYFNPIPVCS